MKYTLTEKAWEINRDKINEGYLYSEMIVYAKNRNTAKSMLLSEYKYEINLKYSDDEISYLNIPVRRCPEADKYLFEEENKKNWEIEEILQERKRINKLNIILSDDSISHCYIKKGGYYRPNSSGYTDFRNRAGVYTKQEAISSAKSCGELTIIPINIHEHNKMIHDEIDDLKTRIIEAITYKGDGLLQLKKNEETHHEYMQRIKRDDPILHSELTSDPTGVGNTSDSSGCIFLIIFIIGFILWGLWYFGFVFNK